jgi:hypothetical protein
MHNPLYCSTHDPRDSRTAVITATANGSAMHRHSNGLANAAESAQAVGAVEAFHVKSARSDYPQVIFSGLTVR